MTKYKRYVPAYRKDLRWRQETCDPAYILAFLEAKDRANQLGEPVDMKGFPNRVHPDKDIDRDLTDEKFIPNKR